MVDQPSIKEICDAGGALKVSLGDGLVAFAAVHPQWGGYCFPCVVSFSALAGSNDDGLLTCFDVLEWHDGDFATDDARFERHYCDPMQVINFGVLIVEQMVASGYKAGPDEIDALVRRLEALKAEEVDRR